MTIKKLPGGIEIKDGEKCSICGHTFHKHEWFDGDCHCCFNGILSRSPNMIVGLEEGEGLKLNDN